MFKRKLTSVLGMEPGEIQKERRFIRKESNPPRPLESAHWEMIERLLLHGAFCLLILKSLKLI
jgi:hypothetical protein